MEVQRAVTSFLADGHYLRHLRRMKRLYVAPAAALREALRPHERDGVVVHPMGGLAVRVDLPEGADDGDVARRALAYGLAPVPLSAWYGSGARRPGLLLRV